MAGRMKVRPGVGCRRAALLGFLGSVLLARCSPHYPRRDDPAEPCQLANTGGSSDASGGAISSGGDANGGAVTEASAGAAGFDACPEPPCASGGAAGASGEASRGGVESGGAATGGASGGTPSERHSFILGADISSVPEALDQGAVFADTDGVEKPIADLLKAHGFNFIRLRSFVDPSALFGYDNPNGEDAYRKSASYCDGDHTAEFGKTIKDAGMGLLVNLHYSDNWADPGKQVIPERWRNVSTIEELGENVKTYTSELIQNLVAAGARPDIVQIGNEITPGMLIQVPAADPQPDQWGNMNKVTNAVNGSASNWTSLGLLLKKGIEGVRAVDPEIKIMLHIENTSRAGAVVSWVRSARAQGVDFDILGLSCYTTWQGQPDVWEATFHTVADAFPELTFIIAEYGLERRRANDIMYNLPDARGLGTFLWEPTEGGVWGGSMFNYVGSSFRANPEDFSVYDGIRDDYGLN
jgi:arabinogalactan endo-1,4-beta-galactosidase